MTTRIDEALEYLGKSDHRFYTMIVGGGLLFIAQFVFVWGGAKRTTTALRLSGAAADIFDNLSVLVGLLAFLVVLGYLTLVNRGVAHGERAPPTFSPFTFSHWRTFLTRGAIAAVILGVAVWLLNFILNAFVGFGLLVSNRLGSEILIVDYVYGFLTMFVIVFGLVYTPYVLLSVFLLIGRRQPGTKLISILIFRNRPYLAAWGLMLILLVFEGDLVPYLDTLLKTRRFIQSRPGSESLLNSFVTFYLLVSIVYLLSDALTDSSEQPDTEMLESS